MTEQEIFNQKVAEIEAMLVINPSLASGLPGSPMGDACRGAAGVIGEAGEKGEAGGA